LVLLVDVIKHAQLDARALDERDQRFQALRAVGQQRQPVVGNLCDNGRGRGGRAPIGHVRAHMRRADERKPPARSADLGVLLPNKHEKRAGTRGGRPVKF
jgi:hypothetical protein